MSRSHSTLFVQLRESPTPNPECFSLLNHARYDAVGQRVQKSYGGSTTVYVYDAFGRLNSEYLNGNWSRDYIVDGSGNLMATENASGLCTTCYFGTDHLGSVRIVMDQYANVVARHDYLPFGEELLGTAGRTTPGFNVTNDVTQKFTGQIRDQESGEDFFNARYFTAGLGRFNSADPMNAGADLLSSQSWNGYGYVLGNPLGLVDPSGMIADQPPVDSGGSQQPGQPIVIPGGINGSRFNILAYLKSFHGTGSPAKNMVMTSYPFPANAVPCSTSTGVKFMAPPKFNLANIVSNGATHGLAGAKAAVAQFGYYDYQRYVTGPETFDFYYGYTPVSNIAVGGYLSGTGVGPGLGSLISDTYAKLNSSNGASAQQAQFRNLGFALASGKATYSCKSHP